eukprot:jgi/Botrbrau1/21143/Bobra.0061s0037.1
MKRMTTMASHVIDQPHGDKVLLFQWFQPAVAFPLQVYLRISHAHEDICKCAALMCVAMGGLNVTSNVVTTAYGNICAHACVTIFVYWAYRHMYALG